MIKKGDIVKHKHSVLRDNGEVLACYPSGLCSVKWDIDPKLGDGFDTHQKRDLIVTHSYQGGQEEIDQLKTRIAELEADNKRLSAELEAKIDDELEGGLISAFVKDQDTLSKQAARIAELELLLKKALHDWELFCEEIHIVEDEKKCIAEYRRIIDKRGK